MNGSAAIDIYSRHLQAASKATFTGDLEGVLAHIAIPSHIQTADRDAIVTSPEELDLLMQDYSQLLQHEGVTEEVERCLEASFVPGMDDMVAGTHETTWLFADGRPPVTFRTRILLLRYGAQWKMIWLQSELACAQLAVVSAEFASAQRVALEKISQASRH